eukprot:TRINITY_DN3763_c0_g1_i1.p1 TRINITY_DN3763_c0_g1~~TRINITY_DN3763_c0_g1_i1.p1  ORF type:complete len:640 (+),score=262.56 TRINITY_DN3763_c0_g1_i1:69-1988(+)
MSTPGASSGQMTCVILVAGHNTALEEGMRRQAGSGDTRIPIGCPKALLPVPGAKGKMNRAVLDLWWDDLKERRQQFSSVYLVTNAAKYKYFERWATANDFPVENIVNNGVTVPELSQGALVDLHLAVKAKRITGDIVVLAGDMLKSDEFDIGMCKRFFDSLDEKDVTMYYDLKPEHDPTTRGMISVDPRTKRVTEFEEKPASWHTRQASIVFYCLTAKTVQELIPEYLERKGGGRPSFGSFLSYLTQQNRLYGMKMPADFRLVGQTTTVEEYLTVYGELEERMSEQARANPPTVHTEIAYARVGLMGNPSDGFFGKTIALTVKNFWAEVSIFESEQVRLVPHRLNDPNEFGSLNDLFTISKREGYVGGLRLMQASCKKFYEYCTLNGIALPKKNFTLSYDTNIPRQVGLAGSSCIVTACTKALMTFFGLTAADIPQTLQPGLNLSVEMEELYINAGLQDRVVQVYEGLVYMDFSEDLMKSQGHGDYSSMPIAPSALPYLFLLYAFDPSDSGKIHNDVKERFRAGDAAVVAGMRQFAAITEKARDALLTGDHAEFGKLMDQNFELRRELYSDAALGWKNLAMVELGRKYGGHMKFPGSGGAVVGMLEDPSKMDELTLEAQQKGFVCIPLVGHFPPPPESE